MAEEIQPKNRPRRSRLGRKLAIIFGSFVILLAVLYFVVTSAGFFKSVILPRVAKALHADITVSDASISPFSQITLRNLKIRTTGSEPIVAAEEVHVRYKLGAILRGNIDVSEVRLIAPVVQVIKEPDGTSNLDPLLKKEKSKKEPGKKGEATQLDVRNVALKNATLKLVSRAKDGAIQMTEISHLDFTLDQLKNGQPGKVTLSGDVKMENQFAPSARATNDLLQAKVSGALNFAVTPDLLPKSAQGEIRLEVSNTQGTFNELKGLTGALQADMSPTEIKQLALRFQRGGQALGEVVASGPLDLNKSEGRVNLEIKSIDRNVLNLVGASRGWDFGDSKLNSSNVVVITQNGGAITASGQIAAASLQIRQPNSTTPSVDLNVEYQADVKVKEKTAVLQKLMISGKQNQKDFLRASLDRPMSVNWGNVAGGLPDSTFQLSLQQFNLGEWRALLGTNLPSGQLDLNLTVQSQKGGKELQTKLNGQIQNLALQIGTNAIRQAEAKFELTGQAHDLRVFDLQQSQFELRQNQQSLATARSSGRIDQAAGDINLKADLEASLPALTRQLQMADLNLTNGNFKVSATVTQKNKRQTANGTLSINQLTGRYGKYQLQNYETGCQFGLETDRNVVVIKRLNATLAQNQQAGGTVELSGQYNLTNHAAQITFKLSELNQFGLGTFLEPSLGGLKLASLALNGTGSSTFNPNGASAIKADFKVSNLSIADPRQTLPRTPLNADLHVDAGLSKSLLDIRQMNLALGEGNAPGGSLDVAGRIDLDTKASKLTFKATGLNENALRPVLAKSLGEKRLVSAALNGSGSVNYDPKADSAIKADLAISNLVVEDSQKNGPRTPLSAQLQLDSSIQKQILDLRNLTVKLAPTPRAQNELQVQGRLDLNKTNATPGQLSVRADSLDVTPYYDLFAGSPVTNAPAARPRTQAAKIATTPAQPSPPAKPVTEPEPVQLPFEQLTANASIGRFYLREVAITNLQTTAKFNHGEVTLNPLQLSVNGAPVTGNAMLNLSVPGYRYDVTLRADGVPVAPIARSFSTGSSGLTQGDLIAQVQVRGAGVTGTNLQKNLSGQIFLSLTNLNLEIVGKKTKRLLEPIALVLQVPELTQTPLNWVNARADIGNGAIKLSQFDVLSQALFAQGQGTIRIAEVLTNSPLDIPVTISLRRALAERARLAAPGTSTNSQYVKLPTFATVKGTLGDPNTEINKLVISGLLLQTAGNIPRVGEKASGILQGIGGLLSGQTPPASATNQPPAANAPSATQTNKQPKLNPLDLLRIIPEKKKK